MKSINVISGGENEEEREREGERKRRSIHEKKFNGAQCNRRQDISQSTFAYLYPFSFSCYDVCVTGTVLKRVCQHTINNPSVNDISLSVS